MLQTRIPVTVLTGHLGAGKTTLLNRILTEAHGKKYAVIVNEFGEIGIDGALVVGSDEEIHEMNNGCICCTVRGDLIRVIAGLLRRASRFDGIIVETTGLADPAPVAQTFFADADIAAKTMIDGIVTVVDAKHLPLRLAEKQSREAEEQIAFADVVVLNKCDLVDEATLIDMDVTVRSINRFAKIIRATRSDVPLDQILNIGSFDMDKLTLREEAHEHGQGCSCGECGHHHHEGAVRHDPQIKSISMVADKPLDPAKFDAWAGGLSATRGMDMLRYKGILELKGSDKRFVFQGVHQMMEGKPLDAWPEGEKRQSRFVIIGRNLDEAEMKKGFTACQVE